MIQELCIQVLVLPIISIVDIFQDKSEVTNRHLYWNYDKWHFKNLLSGSVFEVDNR